MKVLLALLLSACASGDNSIVTFELNLIRTAPEPAPAASAPFPHLKGLP